MSRLIKASLLACLLAFACFGQDGADAAPGITVRGFEWRARHKNVRRGDQGLARRGDYARNDPARPERRGRSQPAPGTDPGRLEMPDAPARPAARVLHGYESSVHVKNDGAKVIKSVEWEHVFYGDQERRKELRRFNFRSDAEIGPGEQKFIARVTPSDAQLRLPPRSRQSVVINRVVYADGTVWQRQ